MDALYYGDAITHFVEELNALEVVVDDSGASKMIVVQFNSLVSSSNLAPSTVISLLGCIWELSQTMSLSSPKLKWLTFEKWLKTRHGYKTPRKINSF
ncbi:unnamed protein product [Malus baccata var. baccata]